MQPRLNIQATLEDRPAFGLCAVFLPWSTTSSPKVLGLDRSDLPAPRRSKCSAYIVLEHTGSQHALCAAVC